MPKKPTYTFSPQKASKKYFLPVYEDPMAEALSPLPKSYESSCSPVLRGTKRNPCYFLRCRHHLGIGVTIRNNKPTVTVLFCDPEDPSVPDIPRMPYTCALAFAEHSKNKSYPAIAQVMNCTQQRIQAITASGVEKLNMFRDE
jgi:hypothetical protein